MLPGTQCTLLKLAMPPLPSLTAALCPSTHAAALSLLALLGYQANPVVEAVQAWLAHEAQPAAAGPAAP